MGTGLGNVRTNHPDGQIFIFQCSSPCRCHVTMVVGGFLEDISQIFTFLAVRWIFGSDALSKWKIYYLREARHASLQNQSRGRYWFFLIDMLPASLLGSAVNEGLDGPSIEWYLKKTKSRKLRQAATDQWKVEINYICGSSAPEADKENISFQWGVKL